MSNKLVKAKQQPEKTKPTTGIIALSVISVVFFVLATTLFMACKWAKNTFNVSFSAILNTLLSSLQGTSSDTITPALRYVLPWVLLVLVVAVCICRWNSRRKEMGSRRKGSIIILISSIACLFASVLYVQLSYDILGYVMNKNRETSLYSENYVDPRSVDITPKGDKRNLIYIYLESMETTYADVAAGGKQEVNYIPNLTALAGEHISFSDTESLGGFTATDGAGWTMGAMFATTSGVPFEFPVGNNDMGKQDLFASGIYSLGDFLQDQGYHQEFLCGSDAAFAGRENYMVQHGNYQIFDYETAMEKGYIPQDYHVWWGYEDEKLYTIARDELTRLAVEEEPFNLTMITVDTHHIEGYVCNSCPDTYDSVTANVVSCADRQIGEFIAWCQQQDFYENTTIVITGDHPRMDNCLVEGLNYNERTMYNCYINSVFDNPPVTTGRESTAMDVFPTTLSALGYEIPGNRLGLGVDLFSGEATLVEKMGIDALNGELMKSSRFYVESFAPELLHLVQDEFDSLCTICFYGNDYNADQYLPVEQVYPQGIASWLGGKSVDVKIPLEKEGEVVVRMHVQEVYNSKQRYRILQNGEEIAKGKVKGTDIIEFKASANEGECAFTLEVPDAVSAHELDETNPDENQLSLLLTTITVNEE